MKNFTDHCYQMELQENGALPSPIKDIVIEQERDELYKAFMILEDGTRIWCNYGCIGDHFYSKPFDVEKTKEGWKKDLENFWFNRKKNFGVLVR